jgi:signal transduction histidine kinase
VQSHSTYGGYHEVRTARGSRIHHVAASKGRDPITGEFVTILNEEDRTEETKLRRDLEAHNHELETRVEERTKELRAANEGLRCEIAQRLEAVGKLTGGIAHDFNNLLAIILGRVELIEKANEHPKLAAIKKATLRGAELTQHLLAFSRRQTLNPTPIVAHEFVTELSALLERTLGEAIVIETRFDNVELIVLADQGQLETAVLNIALNARDALPNGGRIVLEVGVVSESTVARHDELEPGPYVSIAVRDNGTGMNQDVANQVFEPFFTTKDVDRGSGLGLSMEYGFTRQSGGCVTIDSRVGEGTTLTMIFPDATGATRNEEKPVPARPPQGKGEHIIVVEDDEELLDIALSTLTTLGYEASGARDAQQAQHLMRSAPPADLLLCDVVLPNGISGPGFVVQVRQSEPDIKVIFMSGYPRKSHAQLLEIDELLLAKPFERAQLVHAIHESLNR